MQDSIAMAKGFFSPLCVNMQRPNKLAKHFLQNYLLQLIQARQGTWACGEALRGVKHFLNQKILLGQPVEAVEMQFLGGLCSPVEMLNFVSFQERRESAPGGAQRYSGTKTNTKRNQS